MIIQKIFLDLTKHSRPALVDQKNGRDDYSSFSEKLPDFSRFDGDVEVTLLFSDDVFIINRSWFYGFMSGLQSKLNLQRTTFVFKIRPYVADRLMVYLGGFETDKALGLVDF